jgi:hypothetical protein
MSTVDPVAREHGPVYARRRRLRWTLLSAATAAVGGYGCSVLGDFPGSSYRFGPAEPAALVKVALLLGGLVGTLLVIGVAVRLPRIPGVPGQQTFVLAVGFAAYAGGLFLGTLLPTSIPAFAHTDLAAARAGVRIACGVLAVAAAGLMGWASHRTRRDVLRARLRRSGRRVAAEVTEVHDTGITSNNAPRIRLTVRFTDSHGTARFVRRHVSVVRFAGPSVGDRISLWYDPNDPGNQKKIVVGEDH